MANDIKRYSFSASSFYSDGEYATPYESADGEYVDYNDHVRVVQGLIDTIRADKLKLARARKRFRNYVAVEEYF